MGIEVGPDASIWPVWWEFNKDRFLGLRQKVRAATSDVGDRVLGRGVTPVHDALPPSDADRQRLVVPALRQALLAPDSSRDIVSACLVALARIGGDPAILEPIRGFLADPDQEKRETAALALGISALPAALSDLMALVEDGERGRSLVAKPGGVDTRTRAFACYGLGLVAARSPDAALQEQVFARLRAVLETPAEQRIDVEVAALLALRMLQPDPRTRDGQELRHRVIECAKSFAMRDSLSPVARAHALTTLARLDGGDSDKVRASLLAGLDRRQPHWLQQSAALALGEVSRPDDANVLRALDDYATDGRDEQARNFAYLSIGEALGDKGRELLLARLADGQVPANRKTWVALGLAIHARKAREADAAPSLDGVAKVVREMLAATKSPQPAAGLAIALGILRDADASQLLLERLERTQNDDEAAGYFAVALGMIGCEEAKPKIRDLMERSGRRDRLLLQCATALGLLGDKDVARDLTERLATANSVVVFSAVARALGFIGDRRSLPRLVELLADHELQPLSRAFAAVALGLICDKEEMPWNAKISTSLNYRANVETLTDGMAGVLDIL